MFSLDARDISSKLAATRSQLGELAYYAQQYSLLFGLTAGHIVLRRLVTGDIKPPQGAIKALRRRYRTLLRRDLENVRAGYYARELLLPFPVFEYAGALPRFVRDVPRIAKRMKSGDFRDLPGDGELRRYPAYYRRNFHWQTDGYLSRHSAEVYDLSVEFLFVGAADIMRRQVIPPVARFVREQRRAKSAAPLRLLDVGSGTGRTLRALAQSCPDLSFTAFDLSPYYLQQARQALADVRDVSFVTGAAEELPFRDAHFDIVTSVFLFHELPRAVRRQVVREIKRVLRPGGLLVIEDSAQLAESDELRFFLERFNDVYHEPFYADYLNDDLAELLRAEGFAVDAVEPHFVAKVVTAAST